MKYTIFFLIFGLLIVSYPLPIQIHQSYPAYFLVSDHDNLVSSLGPNRTSASLTVYLTSDRSGLENPGFANSAEPWLCISPSLAYSSYCYWAPSDAGADDGVAGVLSIYNETSSADYTDYFYILQDFTGLPNTTVGSIAVRYKLVYDYWTYIVIFGYVIPIRLGSITTYLRIIIYDLDTNTTIYYYEEPVSTTDYTWLNITDNIPITNHTYRFLAGIRADISARPISLYWIGYINFTLDFADLDIEGLPGFSGTILRINTTRQPLLTRLVIENVSSYGDINGSLVLSGENSSRIDIVNSTPMSNTSEWVSMPVVSNPLYTSGAIALMVSGTYGEINITGYLEISTGGVTARYPIEIRVKILE